MQNNAANEFPEVAGRPEVNEALDSVRQAFASAGAEVFFVVDDIAVPYQEFSSETEATTFIGNRRGCDDYPDPPLNYDEFLYLGFVAEDHGGNLGIQYNGSLGTFVSVRVWRNSIEVAPLAALGVTFGQMIGSTAAHELGHCVHSDHNPWVTPALDIDFNPLNTGQEVHIERSVTNVGELKMETGPASGAYHSISLVASGTDTFGEIAAHINSPTSPLPTSYSASLHPGSSSKYAYAMKHAAWNWFVKPGNKATLLRNLDNDVMYAGLPMAGIYFAPRFCNTPGKGYATSIKLMVFVNKQ